MDMPEAELEMSPGEFYHLVRSQIEHEDNLNSQRLSWFVASQAFLFTAYAIVVCNIQPGKSTWVDRQQNLLVMLIPAVSLLSGLLIYATILAGAMAMINLRKWYKANEQSHSSPLPPVQGYRLTLLFGQAAPLGLPPIFVLVWLVLLASR